mmetsp:Transcript_14277/g.16999  ORF Transcript_14277/g.16999 Transcript_14277/m.16999 type:complete len:132 (+) Transcript_14277:147-542(+)
MNGDYDAFLNDAIHSLGAIIVLDQFSRNMFRGDPKSFASDAKALEIAKASIEQGFDKAVDANSMWIYMPFMHSENLADQNKCVELFASGPDFAIKHRDIIEKFGCFPHRNEVLGRESTPEMIEFMKENKGF